MKLRYLLAVIMGTLALDIMASHISDKNSKQFSEPSLKDCLSYCDQTASTGQCLKFNRALGGLCNNHLEARSFVSHQ